MRPLTTAASFSGILISSLTVFPMLWAKRAATAAAFNSIGKEEHTVVIAMLHWKGAVPAEWPVFPESVYQFVRNKS